MNRVVDSIQERLVSYACALNYDVLPPEVIQATKVRVIDSLGALISGFFGEPCRIARSLAAQMPNSQGATVIGTRLKTTPDMAAFVNGVTTPYTEMTDVYHWPGSSGGHPSDVVSPALAVSEYAHVTGRDFITSVVLSYEIYLRVNDIFPNLGFDHTNFCCLAAATAAGKLLGLSPSQLSHGISMAVVPNNGLRVARVGRLSMWKVGAAGQASRAGVFAALLARAGMEGPHLPFEGKAGWCDHVALKRFSLDTLGGTGASFKILDTSIKLRASSAFAITAILAAEKVAPLRNIEDVKEVTVELYKKAKDAIGTSAHLWNPDSKETADHSVAFLVAATLMDGTLTERSFDETHLRNPRLRALMQKIKAVENEEFTEAFGRLPVKQRARVHVVTGSGEQLVGEAGDGKDDLATPKSDAQIAEKFRGLTEDFLGTKRVNAILDRLWHLDELKDVAVIPPDFVIC